MADTTLAPTVDAGEPMGTGWRTAAWMAFGLAALLAFQMMTTTSQDFVHAALIAAGTLLAMLFAVLGIVFAIFGAAASASVGDRRPQVVFPVLANAALLLLVVGVVFAP
jgi:hypothetical protein